VGDPRDCAGRTPIATTAPQTRPSASARASLAGLWHRGRRLVFVALVVAIVISETVSPALAQVQGDQGIQGGWAIDDGGSPIFVHSVADQLPLMRQAGAGWVRINFRLGACYQDWTTPGCNGRTALQAYDEVISRARAQNLQVLGLLSNESWPGDQDQWIANSAETAGGSGDNAYVRAFASSAAGPLARHFASQVGWWEVWNEPNAWTERDGSGNPRGGTFLFPSNFAWMLRRAQAAIKSARADAVVVSGGLLAHDQGGATFFVRPATSLVQADNQQAGQPIREVRHGERVGQRRSARTAGIGYAASACQETRPTGSAYLCDVYVMGQGEAGWSRGASPLDHIGLHLYVDQGATTSREKLTSYLQEIRAAYTAYDGAGSAKQILMTEGGWTTDFVSAAVQAANVRVLYDALRSTTYVGRGFWFGVQDIPEAGLAYGLFDGDRRPKPALAAYQQATTGSPPPPPPPACTPRPKVSVQTGRSGDGRLLVTVGASGANNWLTALRFSQTSNALVDLPGQSGRAGGFTIELPSGTIGTQFWIRRAAAGASTVQVTVVDRCGDWRTLVGGGPSAF
jgi:hypothetical protein